MPQDSDYPVLGNREAGLMDVIPEVPQPRWRDRVDTRVDTNDVKKARGAFFTPPEIASYLVAWAVRTPQDTVFEPSCGEASFLLAAGARLNALGADPPRWGEQLHGIEIFEASARNADALLLDAGFETHIAVGDFFEYEAPVTYDAVVGNPPFVRYQSFSGAIRTRSLAAALAQGVRLSGLANAWAAFVVKATVALWGIVRNPMTRP